MKLTPLIALAAIACAPTTAPPAAVKSEATTVSKLAAIATGARRCWFAGQPRFRSLALIDERDSQAPRLLVVDRSDPQGRPKLVMEVSAGGRLQVYGPLADARTVNEATLFARTKGRSCA